MRPLDPLSMTQAVDFAKRNAAYLASCFAATAERFPRSPKKLRRRYSEGCSRFADSLGTRSPAEVNVDEVRERVSTVIRAIRGELEKQGVAKPVHDRISPPEEFPDAVKWNEFNRWKGLTADIASEHLITLREMPASSPASHKRRHIDILVKALGFLTETESAPYRTFSEIEVEGAAQRCKKAVASLADLPA